MDAVGKKEHAFREKITLIPHQTGDIFTKALDEKAFLRHRDTFYK